MEWFNNYQTLTEKEKEMFIDCSNRLLAQSILISAREEDKVYFRFCEKNIEIFKEYFSLSGWKVNLFSRSIITLQNSSGKNKLQLNLLESILLFVLTKLYMDKSSELSLSDKIFITNLELREQYMTLQISNRLPAQEELKKALRLFQRHSIIDFERGEINDENATIFIYDSIKSVITIELMDKLNEWLTDQNNNKEQTEEIEDNEIDY